MSSNTEKHLIGCRECGGKRLIPSRLEYLSEPVPANEFRPNTFILWWVSPCCRKATVHTAPAASFGKKESDKVVNLADAKSASEEFNNSKVRTVDSARAIVRKHHGSFIFDQWLDSCAQR